jgi:hypothetical protein
MTPGILLNSAARGPPPATCSFTVDLLVDKGYDVVVMDNYEYQVHLGRRPDYLNGKAKYIVGDVMHEKHWMRALEDVVLPCDPGIDISFNYIENCSSPRPVAPSPPS